MKKRKKKYDEVYAILSLSLLTVMAGAAVAPALNSISRYFVGSGAMTIQLIVSIPAVFIVITNLLFPRLCRYMGAKSLVMVGLVLYTFGGSAAGLFDNIYVLLAARSLVGIGVGIIMPLSTGLLSFYFPPSKLERLMGLSSAMNQLGGVIAMLMAGILCRISWRASFLVYMLGLLSIVLCLIFIKNDRISSSKTHFSGKTIKDNAIYIVAIFLLMITFFIYPSNFAMETAVDGIVPEKYIAYIMAVMDLSAFFGGLCFAPLKKYIKDLSRFVFPVFFGVGYLLLAFCGGWSGSLIGSALVGFANGIGIPYIITAASQKAGRMAATTAMPLISAGLYSAQFLTPFIVDRMTGLFEGLRIVHISYCFAVVTAVFLGCVLIFAKSETK